MDLIDTLAIKLWNYHHVGHALEKADVIFALGSHDLSVARFAAHLFQEGWAPLLAFSGGIAHQGDSLRTGWDKSEAEMFAEVAMGMGIRKEEILIEDRATNTGENFAFMERVFKEQGLNPKKIILVQKPYMERRALATALVHWPEREFISTSMPVSYEEYTSGDIPKERIINIMVGDLQRIKLYGEKGFQIPQDIPADVWAAYMELVQLGYTSHLISED
ncbi:MAG: YdcF family protein [Patescibacteria group bacterium]